MTTTASKGLGIIGSIIGVAALGVAVFVYFVLLRRTGASA